VSAYAIDWSKQPFALGAYSYAVPEPSDPGNASIGDRGPVLLAGEALYRGRDMGTVEAALASGLRAAKIFLASSR
jgi:monoamine oxidase